MSSDNANIQDDLLLSLGSPGRFQVIFFLLLCTNAFPFTFNFIFITWFNTIPPHHCKVVDSFNDTNNTGNYIFDECHMYIDPDNHSFGIQSCNNGYTFHEGYDHTIASEWDLVCDKDYLSTMAATIFFAGVMFGGFIFGTLADKFGRKPVILLTLYGQAIIGIGTVFSSSYNAFVVLKFVQGALLQGLQSSNNSLVMEMFPLRYRTIAGTLLAMCTPIAHTIVSGILYLIPNWKWMQLTISLLTILTLSYSWCFTESIRWLFSQNKKLETMAQIQKVVKFNKISLGEDLADQLDEIFKEITIKTQNVIKYDIRDLIRTTVIRRYAICLAFSWFSVGVTYFGIQFYIPRMKGRYLNLFLSGAVESVTTIFGYFLINRMGRRNSLVLFYTMSGVFCIVTAIIQQFTKQLTILSNVLAILGKLFSSLCIAFNLIYASEIFPTIIRTIGLGVVASFSRIGAMLAPQILINTRNHASLWISFIIFGSLSLISAGLHIIFLPETLNVSLPNTIDDVKDLNIKKSTSQKRIIEHDQERGIDNPAMIKTIEDIASK